MAKEGNVAGGDYGGHVFRERQLDHDPSSFGNESVLLGHGDSPSTERLLVAKNEKSRRGGTPQGVRPRRLTLQPASRQSRVALYLVIRQPVIIRHEMQNATSPDLQSFPPRHDICVAASPQPSQNACMGREHVRYFSMNACRKIAKSTKLRQESVSIAGFRGLK